MKLVAFDTQCSKDNGFYCEMCKFSYAVSNDIFHIITSDEIYIKAKKPTGKLKRHVKIDEERLSYAPDYKSVHRRIGNILGMDDSVFLAHSPASDFRHFWCMDKGYQTDNIPCKAYDIHTIVRNYAYLPSYSLHSICWAWGIEHKSKSLRSNAEACIRIMEFICKESGLTIEEIIQRYGQNAMIDSELVYHKTKMEFKRERLLKCYTDDNKKNGKFNGITFSLAESFEETSVEVGLRIAEYIVHNGGNLITKASECDVFIWDGDLSSQRLNSVNISEKEIKVIDRDTLFGPKF